MPKSHYAFITTHRNTLSSYRTKSSRKSVTTLLNLEYKKIKVYLLYLIWDKSRTELKTLGIYVYQYFADKTKAPNENLILIFEGRVYKGKFNTDFSEKKNELSVIAISLHSDKR